ncbi:DUF3105 domain-containing protein [Modestobacter sp. NPDC049651]|uniref:DUF3105 domain-containing protein n=1 Tax=unclassified Modestobacter TaxID=2643866 RepID=UPI0033FCD4FD
MPKDPKASNSRPGGASRGGSGGRSGGAGNRPGNRSGSGRTRPPVDVVNRQRPWGLIAAAIAVVVFAAGVLTYAVVSVNKANADKVSSLGEIKGVQSFDYAAGQQHVATPVTYDQSPPVGGPHDLEWADCTGTVYDVDIRHENAVHSLEHGAVWITYNPDTVKSGDVDELKKVVDGNSGLMLSPYEGLTSPISLQSWNHQLFVDSAGDKRVQQFADFMAFNDKVEGAYPEVGASCENPNFVSDPLVQGDSSRAGSGSAAVMTDAPTTPTGSSEAPATSTPAGTSAP